MVNSFNVTDPLYRENHGPAPSHQLKPLSDHITTAVGTTDMELQFQFQLTIWVYC